MGKATNFNFCTHIPSIDRNKSPLQISGKVAGCVVRTLKTFQGTHILGASRGLLCDSYAVLSKVIRENIVVSFPWRRYVITSFLMTSRLRHHYVVCVISAQISVWVRTCDKLPINCQNCLTITLQASERKL